MIHLEVSPSWVRLQGTAEHCCRCFEAVNESTTAVSNKTTGHTKRSSHVAKNLVVGGQGDREIAVDTAHCERAVDDGVLQVLVGPLKGILMSRVNGARRIVCINECLHTCIF